MTLITRTIRKDIESDKGYSTGSWLNFDLDSDAGWPFGKGLAVGRL